MATTGEVQGTLQYILPAMRYLACGRFIPSVSVQRSSYCSWLSTWVSWPRMCKNVYMHTVIVD